jgi:DNA-binding response OmpR family regulator
VLLFGFPVADRLERDEAAPSPGPVLAFRRDERTRVRENDISERGAIVLVVDDEPAAREYLSRVLELEGFDVVQSSTLEDAYEAAHAYKPQVVTLDRLLLAREDGDWLRRFKEDPALARIPLVLVQSEESESMGLIAVSDVVRKPIDPDEVVATIDRLTGASSSPLLLVRDGEDASKWDRCFEGDARRVVTASSVSEAERVLDTATPKAVIVDVRKLERVLSLLEELRRRERTRDVPVVAIHGRLAEKALLHLDSLADRRLTFSELSRRSLQAALRELLGEDEHSSIVGERWGI